MQNSHPSINLLVPKLPSEGHWLWSMQFPINKRKGFKQCTEASLMWRLPAYYLVCLTHWRQRARRPFIWVTACAERACSTSMSCVSSPLAKKKIRENQSFPWIRIFYLDSVLIRSWASHLVRMCVTVKKWKKGSLNHNVGLQQSRALQSIQIFYEQKRDWCHYYLLDLTSATKNIYLLYSLCVQNLYESHRVELPAHFVMHSTLYNKVNKS